MSANEKPDQYEFVLKVHQLRPWPASPQSPEFLAVGWQRGQHRGHIPAVTPKLTSKQYGVYQFNEEIRIVSKLRKSRRSKSSSGYEKKFLHLAIIKVLRGETEDVAQASHGTVIINLADFTAMQQGPKKLAFRVSVNKDIIANLAKIGKADAPTLTITLSARLLEDNAAFDSLMSQSSRGSRITANLATFFNQDKREAPSEDLPAGGTNGAAATPTRKPVDIEPPSGLIKPATQKLTRLDSDGFEIDDDEELPADNTALARQMVGAVTGTPKDGSGDHAHRRTPTGGVVTSMRPTSVRGSAARSSPGDKAASGGAAPSTAASAAEQSAGYYPPPPQAATSPAAAAPSPAHKPAAQPKPGAAAAQARRSTGKTGFIRDWLGSAEPAPGEGPSLALFNGAGGQTAAVGGGLETHAEEREAEAEADEGAAAAERADVVAQLSTSTNTDLRTLLEKKRIQDESDTYAAEVEERESQSHAGAQSRAAAAAAVPAESTEARANGAVAAVDGTPGVVSGAIPQPSAPLPQSDVAAMDGMLAKDSSDASQSLNKGMQWRRAGASPDAGAAADTGPSAAQQQELEQLRQEKAALQEELLLVGILEAAVPCASCRNSSNARPASCPERSKTHVTHTPARRVFRSMLSMAQPDASQFMNTVMTVLRRIAVDQWHEDVSAAFYWWSNVQQMRLFLKQLEDGDVQVPGDWSWLPSAMDPLLMELAEDIVEQLTSMLWHDVVLPMLQRSSSKRVGGDNAQEDALFRWISALDVATDRLEAAARRVEAFALQLLPIVQHALAARVDFLFHQNIMEVGSSERGAPAFGGAGGWIVPDKLLPFSIDGRVSFQTGMQMKMAVMHLTDWANNHDLRDSDDVLLFPYMRAVADTLMMKKDLLLDPETRASVCAGLSMRSLLHILQQFAPDEFSPVPIDPAIIEHLRKMASRSASKPDSLPPYTPPSLEELQQWSEREQLLTAPRRRGPTSAIAQFELQIGDDSDSELQELAASNGPMGSRFVAVSDLWGRTHDMRDE